MLPEIDSLGLEAQIAQMIVIRASGYLSDRQIQYPQWEANNQTLIDLIQNWGVGGVILMGGSAAEIAWRSHQLQSLAKIGLLIAADVEEGVGQRFGGATWFPPPLACMQAEDAEIMGAITAQESLEIGINWLFAPVADVNNNPANPVINVRAFGETADLAAERVSAFIRGAKSSPVLTTAKHFPGHGDTDVDSHLQLPTLGHSRDRFQKLEFMPFQAAIKAGVDSIMTAHVFAPALDPSEIATLSAPILTGILRQQLGFERLIITDALTMAGVAERYQSGEVAVKAILAGADILLMPIDPVEAIEAIAHAVRDGIISASRIKESVSRIWQAKLKVAKPRPLQIPELGKEASWEIAENLVKRSLKFHLPQSGKLADRLPQSFTNLILVDRLLSSSDFLQTNQGSTQIPETLGGKTIILDRDLLSKLNLEPLGESLGITIVQIFSRGNPFRGKAEISGQAERLIEILSIQKNLAAIALYGSPYNLDQLLPGLDSNIPWLFCFGQQPYAQAIALQKLLFET
jgi:beta-glucosidase